MSTAKLGRYAPTGKLGLCYIKFVTANPDGKELLTVERTIFEKLPKNFPQESFLRSFFSKKVGSADSQARA